MPPGLFLCCAPSLVGGDPARPWACGHPSRATATTHGRVLLWKHPHCRIATKGRSGAAERSRAAVSFLPSSSATSAGVLPRRKSNGLSSTHHSLFGSSSPRPRPSLSFTATSAPWHSSSSAISRRPLPAAKCSAVWPQALWPRAP